MKSFNNMTDEQIRTDFVKNHGLKVLFEPYPCMYVVAQNVNNNPLIYAMLLRNGKWVITDNTVGRSFMFKKDGLFGYTDNKEDINENSFHNLSDAILAFHKFYK